MTYYEIDWDRVRNIDDIKAILEAFDFVIPEDLTKLDMVRPYLKGEKTNNNKKEE